MQSGEGTEPVKDVQDELVKEVGNSFNEWNEIVESLGINKKQKQEWICIYKNNVSDVLNALKDDVKTKQNNLIIECENLLQEISEQCRVLQLPIPQFGLVQQDLCLEKQLLQKTMREYKAMINDRQEQFQKLHDDHKRLCTELGMSSKFDYKDEAILSEAELVDYKKHIQELEDEKQQRKEIYENLQFKITEIVMDLKYKHQNEFESHTCNNSNKFLCTEANMEKVQKFYDRLVSERVRLKDEIHHLREKIQHLAGILDEDVHMLNKFLEENNAHTYDCLHTLEGELIRLQNLKKLNIQTFIEKLREEIKVWWDKCQYSEAERRMFEHFDHDAFTEDLLTLHDIELNKLKTYYSVNNKILSLLEKRKELWQLKRTLETEQTADRFKNRAGQLLQEEKQRNKISVTLPKIEQQLLEMAAEYEQTHETPFMTFGVQIEDLIAESHESWNEQRKQRAEKRKKDAISPILSQQKFSIYNPQPGVSYKSSVLTPSAKKIKLAIQHKENRACTSPSKLHSKVNRRLSAERSRRINRARTVSKMELQRKGNNNVAMQPLVENLNTYNDFQDNISDDCRSTMHQEDTSPLARPLPKTPVRTTPSRLGSKSPNARSKLAASNLKLKF